jgi:hypothetical protein
MRGEAKIGNPYTGWRHGWHCMSTAKLTTDDGSLRARPTPCTLARRDEYFCGSTPHISPMYAVRELAKAHVDLRFRSLPVAAGLADLRLRRIREGRVA